METDVAASRNGISIPSQALNVHCTAATTASNSPTSQTHRTSPIVAEPKVHLVQRTEPGRFHGRSSKHASQLQATPTPRYTIRAHVPPASNTSSTPTRRGGPSRCMPRRGCPRLQDAMQLRATLRRLSGAPLRKRRRELVCPVVVTGSEGRAPGRGPGPMQNCPLQTSSPSLDVKRMLHDFLPACTTRNDAHSRYLRRLRRFTCTDGQSR